MLAIEVVCDVLHWYVLSVHTVHGTRKAVVIHLRKEILAKIVLHVSPVRCRSHNGICQLNIKILTVKNIKSCVFPEYSSWLFWRDAMFFLMNIRISSACLTSVPWDNMMTTQQSYWEWSFFDKVNSSCLICWNVELTVRSAIFNTPQHTQRQKTRFLLFVSGSSSLPRQSWVSWIVSPAFHSLCWSPCDFSACCEVQTPCCLWWGSNHTGLRPFYSPKAQRGAE